MPENTIKSRIIATIGLQVVERPRNLQPGVDADEHNIVHELWMLQKQGLVAFKTRRNLHSPGMNLTKIKLTKQGIDRYRELTNEQDAGTR